MLRATLVRALGIERRRRYFVDLQVQGALLRQALCYWLWASATFALVSFVYRAIPAWLSDAGDRVPITHDLGPFLVGSLVLLPIVVFTSIRFSNRFAGPMVRVRRTLKQLAQGETPPPITLRDDDFWSDLGPDINAIAGRLRQSSATPAATSADEEPGAVDPTPEQEVEVGV